MSDILTNPLVVTGKLQEGVNGLHNVTTEQYFALGARYQPKTGSMDRVYRYAKSGAACRAGRGAAQWNTMANGVDWTLLSDTQAIGDEEITFAAATHPAFLKNELFGAPILISDSDDGLGILDGNPQNKVVVENDASLENAALTVRLDTPLIRATKATTYAFLLPNPYSKLRLGSEACNFATMGIPAAYVDAADKYFWVQTWGPAWVSFQGDLGTKSLIQQEAVWRWDGSVCLRSNASPSTHIYAQTAGFVIDKGDSATFIMLQVAP